MKKGPFNYINDLSYSKKDLSRDGVFSGYNSFMTNKAFSYFPDTILYAAEANKYPMSEQMNHDFYLHGLRKRKRFSKWSKADKNDDIDVVSKFYSVNKEIAKDYIKHHDSADILEMREKINI